MQKKGGGVLIAIKKQMTCEIFETKEMLPLESVCVEIPTSMGNIFIYNLYIQLSSSTSIDIFGDSLNQHIEAIKSVKLNQSDSIIILGDFNLNNVKWQSNDSGYDFIPVIGDSEGRPAAIARFIRSEFLRMGLFQMCNKVNDWMNVLDLVYTNVPELVVVENADFPLLPSEKSDKAHRPLQCGIECTGTPNVLKPAEGAKAIFSFKYAEK